MREFEVWSGQLGIDESRASVIVASRAREAAGMWCQQNNPWRFAPHVTVVVRCLATRIQTRWKLKPEREVVSGL